MSFLIIVVFWFFTSLGSSFADKNRILACLEARSVDSGTLSHFLKNENEDIRGINDRSQKCLVFCILKEAVEPPFMLDNGTMDIGELRQHLLSIAEFKYQKNEILTLAQICASIQNEAIYDECEKAVNFVTCFQSVKRNYCHNLFPCSDKEDDDNCHITWSNSDVDKQSPHKFNYTAATDWLRDREEVSKCRFLCMSRMLNYVDAAVIMNQKLISISKPYPILIKKKIESAIRTCAERNELDPCEKWYQFARCQINLINKVQNLL